MKAIWNGVVLAESDDTLVLDGNHYFPAASLKREFTTFSNHRSRSAYGEEQWLSLFVNGDLLPDAVWSYPAPSLEALKDRIAFVRGVSLSD
ncbi:DUF427 domain-containing protein [Inhella proteolytica]|uniref:DUF427 domain-containing protein n=1 Tax=Inhella proteolytica TaxID=2795029 RepID=A0A931NHF9_9BURK|nr:DUF427 domain-containing protein [Inhella proteolytica]MBH9576470.1 DUF427 domain-containing protein [Inhella proteolytica]